MASLVRAGLAHGLASGLGNLSDMLRSGRMEDEAKRRREEDLRLRASEREQERGIRETERQEDMQRMLLPFLESRGGAFGEAPATPRGTIAPTVVSEPAPRSRSLSEAVVPLSPRDIAGPSQLFPARATKAEQTVDYPGTTLQAPPVKERVSLPEPMVEPPVARTDQALTLSQTEPGLRRLDIGGVKAWYKDPERLEQEEMQKKEAARVTEVERMAGALSGTPRFAGLSGEGEGLSPRSLAARSAAEALQAGVPSGYLEPRTETKDRNFTPEQAFQIVHRIFALYDDDDRETGEYRFGLTPNDIIDLARTVASGGSIPEQVGRKPSEYRGTTPVQAARQAKAAGLGDEGMRQAAEQAAKAGQEHRARWEQSRRQGVPQTSATAPGASQTAQTPAEAPQGGFLDMEAPKRDPELWDDLAKEWGEEFTTATWGPRPTAQQRVR